MTGRRAPARVWLLAALAAWWAAPTTTCRCGCPRTFHEHYRARRDCGRCGAAACPRFTTR